MKKVICMASLMLAHSLALAGGYGGQQGGFSQALGFGIGSASSESAAVAATATSVGVTSAQTLSASPTASGGAAKVSGVQGGSASVAGVVGGAAIVTQEATKIPWYGHSGPGVGGTNTTAPAQKARAATLPVIGGGLSWTADDELSQALIVANYARQHGNTELLTQAELLLLQEMKEKIGGGDEDKGIGY